MKRALLVISCLTILGVATASAQSTSSFADSAWTASGAPGAQWSPAPPGGSVNAADSSCTGGTSTSGWAEFTFSGLGTIGDPVTGIEVRFKYLSASGSNGVELRDSGGTVLASNTAPAQTGTSNCANTQWVSAGNSTDLWSASLTAAQFNAGITVRLNQNANTVDLDAVELIVYHGVVDNPPTANAGGPYGGAEGASISVDGSGSSDDNGITLYEWDCTDNGSYDVSSASPTGSSCTYADDGPYTVRLRVTDTSAQQAETTAAVTVTNTAPAIVAAAADPVVVDEGVTANNSGSFSDVAADPISISADFGTLVDAGDGSWTWSFASTDDIAAQTVNVTATDGDGGSTTDSFTLTVNNVPPTAVDNSYTTLEDTSVGGNVITDDTGEGVDSDPGADTLTVTGFDNPSANGGSVAVAGNGDFTYNPAGDFCGLDTFGYTLSDDDGGASNATVTVDVTCVNDEPSFSAVSNQTVNEDSGAQTVTGWVTASAGPANESTQALTFNITGNTNPALFSAAPAVGGTAGNLGELTYSPAANAFGSADITLEVMDDGGTDNGGDDTSPSQTFTITVDNINDPPTFISGGDVITETGSGEQTVPWATGISVGPANENQTPTFIVTGFTCTPATLLIGPPSVDPDGTLRYTPQDGQVGDCDITVKLSDGVDESAPVTFNLELVTASEPIADPQSVETDDGNPLTIVLTGSDPDDQLPLDFQVIEPVTDADTGAIISNSGPFRGTLDTTQPNTNPDGVSAPVVYSPDEPFITNAAIIATESILLKNNSEVISGDVVVNDAGGTLDVRNGADTPAGFAVKADSIDAQNNATIGGDAFCNSGDYSANCGPLALPAFDPTADPLPPFLIGDVNNDNVTVQKKQGGSIAPGIYGDILVKNKGSLSFGPGKYSVRSISTENNATILFSGATEIKVAERMDIGNNSTVGDAVSAGDVLFYVAGSDGTGGGNPPKAVDLGNGSSLFATVYAPNGTIMLEENTHSTGAFLAQHIEVQNNATVTLDSAFSDPPDQFAFEVTDQLGLVSEQAVVLINEDTACRDDAGQIVSIAAYADQAATDGAASINITLRGCESTDVPVTVTTTNGTQGTVSGLPVGPVGPPYEFVVTYTPNDPVPNNRDSFDFTFDNGVSTASATVEINQPPCEFVEAIAASHSVATDDDNPLTITLSGCDPDDGVLSFSTDPASGGSFVDCASCAITDPTAPITDNRPGFTSVNVVFSHSEVLATTTTFDYTATGVSGSDGTTITVEVNPAPVAPVANDDAVSGSLGSTITGNVLANDTDANQDPLTASLVGPAPAQASVFTLNPDGSFVYTHNGTANFTDSFQYSASDGSLSDTATVNVTLFAANITVLVSKSGPAGSEDSLVTSSPAGISCGVGCLSDSASFTTTAPIRLNVAAAPGFLFNGWTGDADCVDGELTPIADRSCVANFVVDTSTPPTGDPILVTIVKDGTGFGRVISSPAGIDCGAVCSATIAGEPRITLRAIPAPGSVFAGFAGGPGGNDCADSQLDAEFPTTCTATFNLAQRTLTIQFFGSGGSVVSSPGGISCSGEPCSAIFANGALVTVSGRPDSGTPNDVTWGGACSPDGTFPNRATVVMTADATCTVTFD